MGGEPAHVDADNEGYHLAAAELGPDEEEDESEEDGDEAEEEDESDEDGDKAEEEEEEADTSGSGSASPGCRLAKLEWKAMWRRHPARGPHKGEARVARE